MKQQYFVFNKTADYQRGWSQNLRCAGRYMQVEDTDQPGYFWSRLLDAKERETSWHRLTMACGQGSEALVRLHIYCAERSSCLYQGYEQSLSKLLKRSDLTDQDRQGFSKPFLVKTVFGPEDILLHDVKGRYVWFRIELMAQGGLSPVVGDMKLRFPKESWLDYLPEVYRDNPQSAAFTEQFLAVFQSLYTDLTEDIRSVAAHFDPDVVGGGYLEWLSTWLGVEDGYLWPEEKLRQLVGQGVSLYRMRGTKGYVMELVRLFTGYTPYVVEHGDLVPYLGDVQKMALLKSLYGDSPYTVTMVLEAQALTSHEAYKALLRIVERSKPAWMEINLVVLKPYIFLDKYAYLGMNTTLDRYRPLHLDGYSALPFTGLGDTTM